MIYDLGFWMRDHSRLSLGVASMLAGSWLDVVSITRVRQHDSVVYCLGLARCSPIAASVKGGCRIVSNGNGRHILHVAVSLLSLFA